MPPNFSLRERSEPILPGIGGNHRNIELSVSEREPATVEELVPERRREVPTRPHETGFPVPKLELPVFEGVKPQWWWRSCDKLFEIHRVEENQNVVLAAVYLHDAGDIWYNISSVPGMVSSEGKV